VQSDGTVRIWGDPPPGFATAKEPVFGRPRAIPGFLDIVTIGAGETYVLAVRRDGAVLQWGDFDGDGPTALIRDPVVVQGVSDAEFVRADYLTGFVKQRDGRVFAWGFNSHGNLCDGTDEMRFAPVEIPALRDAVDIRLGNWWGLALFEDGHVVAWGNNESGVLADGTTTDSYTPLVVQNLPPAMAIVADYDHGTVLTRDGHVYTWGRDSEGQLGRDAPGVEDVVGAFDPVPGVVPGLDHVIAIANARGGCVLRDDGTVYGWGKYNPGAVGDGTTESRPRPVKALLENVARIYGNNYTVHAVTKDGFVYGWGADYGGELGNGLRHYSSSTPVKIVPE
jgi:alpha-tubulin suppressor-like RCC1 family protein